MSTLVLILADFHPPSETRNTQGWPRLSALELLIARARRTTIAGGWRPWLARQMGGPALASAAPAGVAAAGWLQDAAHECYWFATPVHYFAGLDSLQMHPAGLLQLDSAAQRVLCADFTAVFAGAPLSLHATGRRDLLLAGASMGAAMTFDPSGWLGADPSGGLPTGEGASSLKRLGAELEMWLHEHPINRERARQGQLPVSTLWLWGAGKAPERGTGRVPHLYAEDTYSEGLARLCGGYAQPPPERWMAPQSGETVIAILPTASEDPRARLQAIERCWIAPALADLRRGQLRQLQLIIGERGYAATRATLLQFWRTPLSWWQSLASGMA
jgi:hypothetical protein